MMYLAAVIAAAAWGRWWVVGRRCRGTTLTAVWLWAGAALAGLTVNAGAAEAGGWSEAQLSHLQYAAGVLGFCPLMAVLGAKRPQDNAWQWVVLTLGFVVWCPAVQQWLFWPAAEVRVEGLWSWFLLGLLGLGLTTYGMTGNGPAAVLGLGGLWLLLNEQLPYSFDLSWVERRDVWALAMVSAGLWMCRIPPPPKEKDLFDTAWRDFRDGFGMLWALRVMERFNASAMVGRWPVRLGWSGLTMVEEVGEVRPTPEMLQVIDNLLLRFTSEEWIAARRARF